MDKGNIYNFLKNALLIISEYIGGIEWMRNFSLSF